MSKKKNSDAVRLSQRRMFKMSRKRRVEIARHAAKTRWEKRKLVVPMATDSGG